MRPAFRLSIALLALALVSWLGFVGWSIYSMLPRGPIDVVSDEAVRLPEPSGDTSRDPEAELQAADIEPPPQVDSGVEVLASGIGECNVSSDAPLQWYAKQLTPPAEPYQRPASPEELEERAMAGDVTAQWWIGFILQQELLGTPISERSSSSMAPQRFEYMRNFLIMATRNGRRSAAHDLAEAYQVAGRDVVEVAAWLRIAGDLESWERQGLIVLSDEQRAETLRVAAGFARQYDLPVSRGDARGVSSDNASDPAADDCSSDGADPFSLAAAGFDAYRADLEQNARSPGFVSQAELRRKFRDIRTGFVTSLQLGNRGALPMLVALHRTSTAYEDEVAAAAWERVGRELYGTSSDAGLPNASADTLPGLPPSAELPRSGMTLVDPSEQELADDVRRHGVRAGILADQYIMIFGLD